VFDNTLYECHVLLATVSYLFTSVPQLASEGKTHGRNKSSVLEGWLKFTSAAAVDVTCEDAHLSKSAVAKPHGLVRQLQAIIIAHVLRGRLRRVGA
jgi:hypothetical protein